MRLASNNTSNDTQSPPFSNGSSNGRSPTTLKTANGTANGRHETNGSAQAAQTSIVVSPVRGLPRTWHEHDREEVARILIQSLTDLGYHQSARVLSQESGFELEGPEVAAFRHSVLHGDWADAEALLFGNPIHHGNGKSAAVEEEGHGLTLAEGANRNEMLFYLRQQKYLELLEKGDKGRALMIMRQELTPLGYDMDRVHQLSGFMMCAPDVLKQQAGWDGANGESRSQVLSALSKSIAPSTMIPEHRLAVLLQETKQAWINDCLYHNVEGSPSLYLEHYCDRSVFPSRVVKILSDHDDEIWFLAFSHNGQFLATAGQDKVVNIYDIGMGYEKIHVLREHQAGVCHLAWSPDDTKLITCSREPDSMARVWDVDSGTCFAELPHFQHAVSAAAWAPDNNTFVIGSQDCDNSLSTYRLSTADMPQEECELVYSWSRDSKMRIFDVALSPDGRRLVALLDACILVFDFVTRELLGEYTFERLKMTSVTISADSQVMLVSMNENKIRLMDIETGEVLQTFSGHKQAQFMIRSVFGGADESFVVSGSEDSIVYVWRTTGQPVEQLEGHGGGCVNAVAWHPIDSGIFASAGDDRKVRIWSSERNAGSRGNGNGHRR